MENKFNIVSLDDWESLYYKGELIKEGHEIDRFDLVRLMKKYRVLDVDFEYLNGEGEEIVHDSGRMFNTYEEASKYIEA